jgi:EAL domain-containing protein (putative c-di-GMP-specific phosphodiesterase class I)
VAADDAFARLGGDEFGVLLFGHDLQTARAVADSLIDTARRFRFAWQGHTYAVTITIGAALIDSNAADITHAMSMADAACFVAKDAGRDRVLFAGNDDELASRHVQMSMVGKIGKSLDEDRFVLHYEDVVSIESPKQVVYRELLVRMREADGKLLLPASFIQAAERYFLMGALDRWVLRKAFRGIAQLPPDEIIYAVNLSGQSLGDPKLLDFVLAELDSSGVDPKRICFEITETAAVSRLTEAVRFIQRISLCGCRFALDDFGSGMASFNYLKNFTVHFLKIDGSFVRAMLASRADRGMVESINSIGHEMGLKTIAEHVETPAMMQPLRDMGVDWAQGRAIAWGKAFDTLMP